VNVIDDWDARKESIRIKCEIEPSKINWASEMKQRVRFSS
jgi:hypothetical protein